MTVPARRPDRRSGIARTVLRRTGKVLGGFLAVVALLVGAGAVYQGVATWRGQRAHPAPGALVDVGGHRLHIRCAGGGSPTVVLDAALGATSAHWTYVQDEVSRSSRVCAYDRAGLGWSEAGPGPRDARRVTDELHALLVDGGIPGPYVVVGHSLGGFHARLYAGRYPDDVAGVVLVESSHPQQFDRLPGGREAYEQTRRLFAIAPALTWAGAVRLFDLSPPSPSLPVEQREQIAAWAGSTRHATATAAEFRATPDTTAQVGAVGTLGDTPLAVVTAGRSAPAWIALQDDLATLSSDSRHDVVEEATHSSVVDDPAHARATSAAILAVVDAARDPGGD